MATRPSRAEIPPDAEVQLARAEELAPFTETPAALHLARLEGDVALMMALTAEGFRGPTWERFATALVEYGHAVMMAWIRTRQITRRCREVGIGIPELHPEVEAAMQREAEDLASDTVGRAILHFQNRVLARGAWDPRKGASLKTYFVGNCKLQFANALRDWSRPITNSIKAKTRIAAEIDLRMHHHTDPEQQMIELDLEESVLLRLAGTDETNRCILQLRKEGYDVGEVAELLGTSYKAVESRLSRMRARGRQGSR
jgi:RNA polymerase sigma factor (sigma-70 family)